MNPAYSSRGELQAQGSVRLHFCSLGKMRGWVAYRLACSSVRFYELTLNSTHLGTVIEHEGAHHAQVYTWFGFGMCFSVFWQGSQLLNLFLVCLDMSDTRWCFAVISKQIFIYAHHLIKINQFYLLQLHDITIHSLGRQSFRPCL